MKTKAYYIKFNASKWLSSMSKIQLCTAEEKGIFIDLCAMCVLNEGICELDEFLHVILKVSEDKLKATLDKLLKLKVLVLDGSKLSVKFVSEQLHDMDSIHTTRVLCGQKGGRPVKGQERYQKVPSQNKNKNIKKKATLSKKNSGALGEGFAGEENGKPGDSAAPAFATDAIPATLAASEEFCGLWSRWLDYLPSKCAEAGKTFQVQTANMHLLELRRLGVEMACATLKNSMANGWMKLVSPLPEQGEALNGAGGSSPQEFWGGRKQ